MDTRPLRIFLIGTTLAVGAVVGLAPSSEARQPITIEELKPIEEMPPTTLNPPIGLEPCDVVECADPPAVIDCERAPRLCTPPTDMPPEKDPPKQEEPPKRRPPKPIPPRHSDNPDVVYSQPVFTG